ncbi:DUF883 family protein [Alysiella crassa]|uniref:Bacterial protein of uncharacterized function (DUF883) n=1 Tax=Alysiella crassa TaxID=153491 RepID=A0A376BVQ1_9NEIS|nr:DUF883 family protein [Alysiella crassa]UOP06372.1 DUF883 family protein [Alysiella crassa]SSY80885.1 Bacterial protein of uncharacterised function (DUF883) [Alysiella crassa]
MKRDFESQKEALLQDIRTVLRDMEDLYHEGAKRSEEETQALKAKLENKLNLAQERFQSLEDRAVEQVKHHAKRADEYVNEKPYYAMGFAALAGLVVGVLLNRR